MLRTMYQGNLSILGALLLDESLTNCSPRRQTAASIHHHFCYDIQYDHLYQLIIIAFQSLA